MGGFVESMRLCDPANMTNSNGVDPVCPHCDRFISYYKVRICSFSPSHALSVNKQISGQHYFDIKFSILRFSSVSVA